MLTATELASFRQTLTTLLEQRANNAADFARDLQQEAHRHTEPAHLERPERQADPRSDEIELEIDQALLENAELSIQEIEAALERLNAGTFGQCVGCGHPIAKERLKALPSTPYCIQCARRVL